MKTTTKAAAAKRLEALNLAKNSMGYKFAKQVIEGAKTIRPCHTSGSKRFTSNLDYTRETCSILTRIGIEHKLTNDSPRGGLTGNLITITTKIR